MAQVTVFDSVLVGNLFGTEEIRDCFCESAYVANLVKAEVALAQAEEAEAIIPAGVAAAIREHCADVWRLDWALLGLRTEAVGDPVLPLVEQMAELVPDELSGYIHWGASSQDMMDLASTLQMQQGLAITETLLRKITSTLTRMALAYRDVPMAGRTHAQHAAPITFGYKCGVWLASFQRHLARLTHLQATSLLAQFGGAAGSLASLSLARGPSTDAAAAASAIRVRRRIAHLLGLTDPVISWHTARDTVADITNFLALVGGSLGKLAQDLLLLSSAEVGEVAFAEPDTPASLPALPLLPLQRNRPLPAEAMLAASKLVRAQASLVLDAMVSASEGGGGPWRLEWAAVPTAFMALVGGLQQADLALAGLHVNQDAMLRNLRSTRGLVVAEAVALRLARFLGRSEAGEIVRAACAVVSDEGVSLFQALERQERVVGLLGGEELEDLCDPTRYLGCCGPMVDELVGN
ncbi:uncharacterized protein K452DRAFT_322023 [Aplosporella prunicola CBS 121167]|uniref:Adenylosuccinate lyase C-terminal domain-containing protein n=1 Tax=Aplosporella prunicola CBS 121167 TaxID=1176127 RepID=A0A6A6B269_9PEZI|nr:uncharacterized protein K452DRAFT_322023 [Aplosporella prunicola CBS 121167]KAF2137107.1 hypothetical protein K452DRAFT_322023 [Aplosporella prunicola CBS 121167]